MKDHPLRRSLNDEVHARPYAKLVAPLRALHLALLTGEEGGAEDRRHLARLCADFGVAPPQDHDIHLLLDFGAFRLKWERHTEFSTYTFYATDDPEAVPFTKLATERVPLAWLEGLPGEVIVALRVEVLGPEAPEPSYEELLAFFGHDAFCGAAAVGGTAAAWMDFTIGPNGFGRLLIKDRSLRPRQTGRLLQRLLEIDTYRMMSLLALPVARRLGPQLTDAGRRLLEVTRLMPEVGDLEQQRKLLGDLTALSGEIERTASVSGYRFSAAKAYHALVLRRIEELREERLEGLQTFGEFMDRRLSPAMRTCEATGDRIDRLSRRLTRAGQLLRTRVEIELEAQNQDVLARMDRRARLQLRLQETVEGLSVAAITYYVVGLVAYGAKALDVSGLPLDADVAPGVAIPIVAGLVWFGVRRIRRLVVRQGDAGGG
ncbi:MAG: DUF3422 domain-containing protein [Kiloniellales bacterium]|nr:DUF3422 domain-containing protein [Kiloniellales bacterium]